MVSERNLCVTVKIKIYDRICICVMIRFSRFHFHPPSFAFSLWPAFSPVGPARELAIVADLLAGIAAVGAAGSAQQVRRRRLRKRLLEVVARRLASSLDHQRESERKCELGHEIFTKRSKLFSGIPKQS
jgi:hypothetical protein